MKFIYTKEKKREYIYIHCYLLYIRMQKTSFLEKKKKCFYLKTNRIHTHTNAWLWIDEKIREKDKRERKRERERERVSCCSEFVVVVWRISSDLTGRSLECVWREKRRDVIKKRWGFKRKRNNSRINVQKE